MPRCIRSASITTCSVGSTASSSSPSAAASTTISWWTTRSACRCEVYGYAASRSAGCFVEDLVGRRRYHLDIFRDELPALDIFDEFRLDLVGEDLADARVLLDVRPFGDQEEALRVIGVAAQHAVLHLCLGLVHWIAVGV